MIRKCDGCGSEECVRIQVSINSKGNSVVFYFCKDCDQSKIENFDKKLG